LGFLFVLIGGSSLMFGAFIARRFVLRLAPDRFRADAS
jgi:hypothetical protein